MADFTYNFTDGLGQLRTVVTNRKLVPSELVAMSDAISASEALTIPKTVATLGVRETGGRYAFQMDFVGLTNDEVLAFVRKLSVIETEFDVWDGLGRAFGGKFNAGKVLRRSDWLWDGDLIRAQRERDADYADEVRANG